MHPRERFHVWPAHLRAHPATLGETRILWMLARIAALIFNRTRGKDEKALSPGEFLEGLLPDALEQRAPPAKHSMFEGMMTSLIDHLREENVRVNRAARGLSGGEGDDGEGKGG